MTPTQEWVGQLVTLILLVIRAGARRVAGGPAVSGRRFDVTITSMISVTVPTESYAGLNLTEAEIVDDVKHAALVAFRRGEHDSLDIDVEETTACWAAATAATSRCG